MLWLIGVMFGIIGIFSGAYVGYWVLTELDAPANIIVIWVLSYVFTVAGGIISGINDILEGR